MSAARDGVGDVTVVVATYNAERFIAEQIRSLFLQTVLPQRIVVSDDGSTDGTLELLELLAGEAPCPFVIRETGGRRNFRFNFLENARDAETTYVAFCDHDDVWHPSKLEICLRHLERKNAALVIHSARIVDAQLRPTRKREPSYRFTRTVPANCTYPWQAPMNGFAEVFRRSVLDHVDIHAPLQHVLPKETIFHDVMVSLAAGAVGPTVYLRDELALYRQHETNTASGNMELLGGNELDPAARQLYCERAVLGWRQWMLDAADHASTAGDPRSAVSYRTEAERFRRLAGHHHERANLRSTAQRGGRLRQLTKMVLQGRYASRRNGNLGPQSLARDLIWTLR